MSKKTDNPKTIVDSGKIITKPPVKVINQVPAEKIAEIKAKKDAK